MLPIPADHLEAVRAGGRDDEGNPFEPFTDDGGGRPLRCCLRDSTKGERIALIAYRPVPRSVRDVGGNAGGHGTGHGGGLNAGPYHESGPVFVHAQACDGPDGDGYPDDWRARRQVLRCYDRDGRIVGGAVAQAGDGQEEALAELLADDAVAFVHTRNIVYGCFMADVRRAGPGAS